MIVRRFLVQSNVDSKESLFEINLSEYEERSYRYVFHLNVRRKSSEAWIGLMDKSVSNRRANILYYGGRECAIDARLAINENILSQLFAEQQNAKKYEAESKEIEVALMSRLNGDSHGAIHQNGKAVMDKLRPFRNGDWISVCIENDVISFYNNGHFVFCKDLKQNQLYQQDLMLFSLMNHQNDCIFVEQSHSKNGLDVAGDMGTVTAY